jgi:anti-sigma factor (TIGR02949 family)
MDCNQTNKLLNAYVDKELSKSDTTLLESHLAECPSCMAELEDIRRLDARVAAEVSAPAELRSKIADRLDQRRTASPRVSLKEMLGMRYRMGLAAMLAAGLIVVGVMSTGGNAQAAFTRMKTAVTRVTSMHLHIEFSPDAANSISSIGDEIGENNDEDRDDEGGDAMAKQFLHGIANGAGSGTVDVWSKDDMFRVNAFGGIDVACRNKKVTLMFGGKVMGTFPVDEKDIPKNLGEFMFQEFSKATDEMKSHFNVVNRGTVRENGRTLSTLEVTGKDDNMKDFRLMYWVDQSTNLPARFQVFGSPDKGGSTKLICTITAEYNENYPDSLFEPGGVEKP